MDTDFLLIRKMKQGDDKAFEIFVCKYYSDILNYCKHHCADRKYAEDLTQETFVRFFEYFIDYHHRGKMKNYLYTIARNLCIDYYKKISETPIEKLPESKENQIEQLQDKLIIEDALKKLSEEYLSKEVQDNNKAYAKKQGFKDIRELINKAFCEFREYNYYRVDTVSKQEVGQLYEKRTEILKNWLDTDAQNMFSEQEKQFLINQYEALDAPFYYEYRMVGYNF